jgi:PTH1 family peptidyl-tRNA hydrolase
MHRVRVILGLGNPGDEYRDTRHNVGFQLLDHWVQSCGVPWVWERRFESDCAVLDLPGISRPVLCVKPRTYVNRSGLAATSIARYYKFVPEQFCAVYDDIHLEPAQAKISLQGSAGGHNGVADLLERLGSGFVRFRIGIGAKKHPGMDLKDWVLGRFTAGEKDTLQDFFPQFTDGLQLLVQKGAESAMNQINIRNKAS